MGHEVGQQKEDLEERNGTVQQKGVERQRIKDDYRKIRWLLASLYMGTLAIQCNTVIFKCCNLRIFSSSPCLLTLNLQLILQYREDTLRSSFA